MSTLGVNGMENGVEVQYTGNSIYHLRDNDGHYDGKIQSDGRGGYNEYHTSNNWGSHLHVHYDADGNKTYDRAENVDADKHPWTTYDD